MEQEQLEILGLQELEDGTHLIHARGSSTPLLAGVIVATAPEAWRSGLSFGCN